MLNGVVCETGWVGLEGKCACAGGCVVPWTLAESASPTVPDSGSSNHACLMRENRELKKAQRAKTRERKSEANEKYPALMAWHLAAWLGTT